MLYDVIAASYEGQYKIALECDDGSRGVVDFSSYLQRGGVFEPFKDIEFFRGFRVDPDLGTLAWGDQLDIAPETLYAAAMGRDLPAWMETEGKVQGK